MLNSVAQRQKRTLQPNDAPNASALPRARLQRSQERTQACLTGQVGSVDELEPLLAALVAFVDVPIVHFSVTWWRTLHQEATVFNPELDAKIHGTMALALWIGVLAFTLLYAYLLDLRYRLETLEEDREERELEAAIANRVRGSAPREPVGATS